MKPAQRSLGDLSDLEAILFDVGSTMLEYRAELRHEAWADILGMPPGVIADAWRGARRSARELTGFEGRDDFASYQREVCSDALQRLAYEGEHPPAIGAMVDVWIRIGWLPYPEVHEALSQLHAQGYRLGVVSNWTPTLEATLEQCALAEYFDVIACSALVGAFKPDRRIFQHAVDALDIEAGRILYVGDHFEVDVLGARQAGMQSVLIARDGSAAHDHGAITSLKELLTRT